MDFTYLYQNLLRQFYEFSRAFGGGQLGVNITEVVILALILVFVYKKYIKGTHSEALVRGIFGLLIMWLFSEFLIKINLQIFGMFLKTLVSVVTVGLIVIFQPELRRFLGYIGQNDILSRILSGKKAYVRRNENIDVVKELIETIKYMSRLKIGGLIVLQKGDKSLSHSDVGVEINGNLSQELLLTIFHPKTPLHDGAVVINNDIIQSAGVLLPLTEDPKLSWRYGTRHRAAIGVTEMSDCACIVISEETGDISIAIDGNLKKYDDLGNLKVDLERILGLKDEEEAQKPYMFKFENILPPKKNK